jgi:uncharacterized protein with LGFP repeats
MRRRLESTGAISEGIVRKLSAVLGGEAWSRRSFLVRTAVFGSAVAMDLRSFALTPGSAYDSVCGTLANCEDGFTAFCCTINHGVNLCPSGTFVGGWWMADRSAYCRGDARYYVDCNAAGDRHWSCHCSDSPTCDKRKVACNIFRYGNCNTDIATYSAVVCRVITCTPPWVWESGCNEATFVDQVTASQSAPCLPGPWASPIEIKWSDLGGRGSPLGPAVTQVRRLPHGDGKWQEFRNGAIFDVAWLGLHVIEDPVWRTVKGKLGRDGIGYPARDVTSLPQGHGWTQEFVNRSDGHAIEDAQAVGTRSLGTHLVTGEVRAKWHALGAQGGVLGFPTTSTAATDDGIGTYGEFEKQVAGRLRYRGAIFAHPVTGPREMHAGIYAKWVALGGQSSPLGLPASDEKRAGPGAVLYRFAVVRGTKVSSVGAIVATKRFGVFATWGAIAVTWELSGAQSGPLGYPTADPAPTPDGLGSYSTFSHLEGSSDVTGNAVVSSVSWGTWMLLGVFAHTWITDELGARTLGVPAGAEVVGIANGVSYGTQAFSTGAIYNSVVGAACVLYGPILEDYLGSGGPSGSLGLPTSSVTIESNGEEVATFQGGELTYQPSGP